MSSKVSYVISLGTISQEMQTNKTKLAVYAFKITAIWRANELNLFYTYNPISMVDL